MRCSRIILATLALTTAPGAFAQTPDTGSPTITVIGPNLGESEARLKACIARQCSVSDEIDATLGHAEAQFVAGHYRDARATLQAGISRNRRHADSAPEPVADLLRADARVAAHLGFAGKSRQGMMASEHVLRRAFGEQDRRAIVARIATADAWQAVGRFEAARDAYAAAARLAREADAPRIEGMALLRRASLDAQLSSVQGGTGRPESLEALLARTDPELEPFVNAARIVEARIRLRDGDPDAMEAIIASARQSQGDQPLLLHKPVIVLGPAGDEVVDRLDNRQMPKVATMSSELLKVPVEDNWADFGFWIGADGRVRDVELLRAGPRLSKEWPKLVLRELAGRRYAPMAPGTDDPGFYRVERYSMTSAFEDGIKSRIRSRSAQRRLVRLDLTAPPKPATTS
ncbi:hypothetical protein [Sphingomonas sp. IW22]|uniref:hypothetical protein n=1 Tax=Sphingomonas sp. IW22 TaxID=3242489 RepID=UPI00352194C8